MYDDNSNVITKHFMTDYMYNITYTYDITKSLVLIVSDQYVPC